MDTVEITLPVSRAAAERLGTPENRARLGVALSLAADGQLRPEDVAETAALLSLPEPARQAALVASLAEAHRAVAASGLTPDEVEEELAAWRRERAGRPRR